MTLRVVWPSQYQGRGSVQDGIPTETVGTSSGGAIVVGYNEGNAPVAQNAQNS